MNTDAHTTHGGDDTTPTRMMTGDVSFEAAIVVSGTVRVSVIAGDEEQAAAVARQQVRGVIAPSWDILSMSFARALHDELGEHVRSLHVMRQLEDDELELLVRITPDEPQEVDDGCA